MTLDEAFDTKPIYGEPAVSGWLPFCMVEVSTGGLWVGDPLDPKAEAGTTVDLPIGMYRVDGKTLIRGAVRLLGRLRICKQEYESGEIAEELGGFGTRSGVIGIADLAAFVTAYQGDLTKLAAGVEKQVRSECCLVVAPGVVATMPVVPSMFGEADGPVVDLLGPEGERIGFDLVLIPEVEAGG